MSRCGKKWPSSSRARDPPKVYSSNTRILPLRYLSLDSVNSLWESSSSLSLSWSDSSSVLLGQGSSQSSGLLLSQVLWNELLVSVESSDVLSLESVDDSQNSGNVLSDNTNLRDSWSGQLLDLERSKLLLQLEQLLLQLLLRLSSQFGNLNSGLLVSNVFMVESSALAWDI